MPEQTARSATADMRFFAALAIALSLLVVASYALGSRVERGDNSVPTERVRAPFPPVSLKAKSAYVYDARTKTVLFAKNENTRLPLASLTKLMSALVASELSPSYGTVTVSSEAMASEGDTGLRPGERWALKDLLDFSLVASSNDGIKAVALALADNFVGEMNKKAAELDLKNSYFWNETGLDETELKGGAYGTARDIAALMEYIITYHPEMLEATSESSAALTSLDRFEHVARNTNVIANSIPGLIGSKTGFTQTAGGNLALAFDPEVGRPIIITILGSTEQGRFEDAQALITATLKYISGNE